MRFLSQRWLRGLLNGCLLIAALGHALSVWTLPGMAKLEAQLYDLRLHFFMPGGQDERVVIIDIDERSLAEVGRWPWGRDQLSRLVDQLTQHYQVAVLGFDVVFAEPDTSSGLPILEGLAAQGVLARDGSFQRVMGELRHRLDYDQRFADSLRGQPVVLGYTFAEQHKLKTGNVLPAPVMSLAELHGQPTYFVKFPAFSGNLEALQEAAGVAGHFNPFPDEDGTHRRVPMLLEHEGQLYEALSLAMLRRLLPESRLELVFMEAGNPPEWLDVVTPQGVAFSLPLDAQGAVLVPYRGRERSFPYVSAVDILNGKVSADILQGRIALLGTSALGLMDLRSTPVGGAYPGVEVHANLIAGMLDGTLLSQPGFVPVLEAVLILFLALVLWLGCRRASPLRASLVALSALLLLLAINLGLWQSEHIVVPLAVSVLFVMAIYVVHMTWGYFVETRNKRQFAGLFGQYVPPELVEVMARDPEHYSMEARSKELTVLFSDIRDFTTLAEGLTPQALMELLNDYLGEMTNIIRREQGTLDKYIGDAIMAFWGAPVDHPLHPRQALQAALAMQAALPAFNQRAAARGWPALRIGIGVNSGLMTVGDMGSAVRKAYTVLGDAVNLAARLEGLTKFYGVGILVGESVVRQVSDHAFRPLGWVRVKGKQEAVRIYEPLGPADLLSDQMKARLGIWDEALSAFAQQRWADALSRIHVLQADEPERVVYQHYVQQIEAFQAHGCPEGWQGVTIFESK